MKRINFPPLSRILLGVVFALFSCGQNLGTPTLVNASPAAVTPSPTSDLAPRIAEIDRAIAEIQSNTDNESPTADTDLDEQIAARQEMIASLSIEASVQQSTQANELQILQQQQNQTTALLSREITTLAEQIRAQEQVVAAKQQQLAVTIAPEDSDLRRQAVSDYSQSALVLDALRNRYAELRNSQYANNDVFFSQQKAQLESTQSRQAELAMMIRSAQMDIARLEQEKKQLASARSAREQQLQNLTQERERLLQGSAQ